LPFWGACTTTDYFGKTYPPTQGVDVFFSPQDVRRAYEVMGEIRAQADELMGLQAMQRQLMNEAMQKGADAISIEHVGQTETGFTTVENRIKERNSRANHRSPQYPRPKLKQIVSLPRNF
jgi:hypothetical protein